MSMSFLYLTLQTIVLWFFVIFLHRQKNKLTLIPLYAYISVLTLLTHNLSDLGFSVAAYNFNFLISSFSFFTSVMLGVLFLYLFDGPRATRLALVIILGTSALYIGVVGMLGLLADTHLWVFLSPKQILYYFWSITAIIIDVFFITIFWEILKKTHVIPLIVRIFLVVLGTYALDTFIFATGVFGGQEMYFSILRGDLLTRLILALFITPIITFYLDKEGYQEEKNDEKRNVWEILNFRSDLESKLQTMEGVLKLQKELEVKLKESQEKYQLALEGVNAGIWDWDVKSGQIVFSTRFCTLLGYETSEMPKTIEEFKKYIHPNDREKTFVLIEECFKSKKILSLEYRLQTKEKSYKWFLKGGIVQYSEDDKPIRMVGSIIDIDEKKQIITSYEEKVRELEKLNQLMVGRELQMIDLKEEIKKLKVIPS